jgi:hypothetical protein
MNMVRIPYNRVVFNDRPNVYYKTAPHNINITRSKTSKEYTSSLTSAADNVINMIVKNEVTINIVTPRSTHVESWCDIEPP